VLLIVAGFQVPATLFVDVAGKAGAVVPEQKSAIEANVGVTAATMFNVSVDVLGQSVVPSVV